MYVLEVETIDKRRVHRCVFYGRHNKTKFQLKNNRENNENQFIYQFNIYEHYYIIYAFVNNNYSNIISVRNKKKNSLLRNFLVEL